MPSGLGASHCLCTTPGSAFGWGDPGFLETVGNGERRCIGDLQIIKHVLDLGLAWNVFCLVCLLLGCCKRPSMLFDKSNAAGDTACARDDATGGSDRKGSNSCRTGEEFYLAAICLLLHVVLMAGDGRSFIRWAKAEAVALFGAHREASSGLLGWANLRHGAYHHVLEVLVVPSVRKHEDFLTDNQNRYTKKQKQISLKLKTEQLIGVDRCCILEVWIHTAEERLGTLSVLLEKDVSSCWPHTSWTRPCCGCVACFFSSVCWKICLSEAMLQNHYPLVKV